MENENWVQELKSAEELHRFEAGMMLGQTAVYIVATGAMLNYVGSKDVSQFSHIAVAIFGIILSAAFLLIVHRTGQNLRGAKNRAEELCNELKFKIYSSNYRAPKHRYFVGKNVTKIICFCGGALWIACLVKAVCG